MSEDFNKFRLVYGDSLITDEDWEALGNKQDWENAIGVEWCPEESPEDRFREFLRGKDNDL